MKVKFIPQNIELEVTPDKSLLQIATENQIDIKSICKGVPSCAECRVRVVEGENNVLPPSKPELNLIGTNWRIDSRRLSCQLRCFGDVTVDLTEQIEKQESQTKKVRGFRSQKHVESQAVQDTMLLTEKPEDRPSRETQGGGSPEIRTEGALESRSENRSQQQNKKQGQGQQQGQKQKQHQGQQRQQGGGQNQGGGQKSQGPKGGQQGQQRQGGGPQNQGPKPKQQHPNQNQQQNQNKNPKQQQQQPKPQNQK